MKVYIKNEDKFEWPEEMSKILKYLKANGEVLVEDKKIENLYYEFSYYIYCASWMSVNEQILEEFANWLSDIDI